MGEKQSSGAHTGIGIILIILGFLAILTPIVSTFAITFILGWILLIVGIMQLIFAFTSKGWGSAALKIITGILALIIGILMLVNPIPGVLTLTLLLTAWLIVSGIFYIIGSFAVRPNKQWSWMLFSGIISLILGMLIWSQWPISAVWVIGLLVGLQIMFIGFALLAGGKPKIL